MSYIAVFLSLAIGSQLSDARCPFKYYKVGEGCYQVGYVTSNAPEAMGICLAEIGYLVNFDTEEEYHNVIDMISQSPWIDFDGYWTGANSNFSNYSREKVMKDIFVERLMYPNTSPYNGSMYPSVWITMQGHFALMIYKTRMTGISYICETGQIW